jgi:hypothetical protein
MITAEIKAHHPAIIGTFQKAADTVGKILRVDPAGPGSPAFRKYHQVLPFVEEMHALLQDLLHLSPVPPATDGNALIDITKEGQQEIPLKIRPFRQVPGQQVVLENATVHGEQGIGQNNRINHGQVIGTDHPGPLMLPEEEPALPPDIPYIADAVSGGPNDQIIQRRQKKRCHPAQNILQMEKPSCLVPHKVTPKQSFP